MITFDTNGNPQPPGLINFGYEDFKQFYFTAVQNSSTRNSIIEGYESYIRDFKEHICPTFSNWVNGSFTTNTIDPNDIDIVNIVQYTEELNNKGEKLLSFLTDGGSKEQYLVDGYFVPVYDEDDPRYSVTIQYFEYWQKWFGHDRQNRPKALIELSFS